jgi:hypothetical protein
MRVPLLPGSLTPVASGAGLLLAPIPDDCAGWTPPWTSICSDDGAGGHELDDLLNLVGQCEMDQP